MSPRGVYIRKKHGRITKAELKKFVLFTMRADIKSQLDQVKRPHQLSVKLYEKESGVKISSQTAYNALNKWILIDNELVELKNNVKNDSKSCENVNVDPPVIPVSDDN